MDVTIAALSDTHCRTWDEVHPNIRKILSEADIVVHCGDFVHSAVVDGLRANLQKVVLVHGNSDPPELRKSIPYVEVIEVKTKRIGVIHPAWGGPEFELEDLLPDFIEPVDVIIFGHLHEPINETRDGLLFVNPGQAYSSFMVPATVAVLTVSDSDINVDIRVIEKAR